MPFSRPTLAELITRTTADLVSRLSLQSEVLRRAVVRDLSRAWSGAVNLLHGHLDWAARQLFASTADEDNLVLHGADIGVNQLAATYANGDYVFTGVDGSVIPAGTTLQRSDGVLYDVQADAEIDGTGQAIATIRARTAGAASNSDAGVALQLVSPIAGVNSAGVVDAGGIVNGSDLESAANYRARILERKRRKPQGGAEIDYITWSKEVAGVTRVWIRRRWMGPGTVGVLFVCDGQVDIIPSPEKVAEVQTYIDATNRRPVTADVFVVAPVAVPVDFSIALAPNTAAVRTAVEAELQDYLKRVGEPGVRLPLSNIIEAISAAPGETSHVLSVPAVDPEFASNEIPVMGAITWL